MPATAMMVGTMVMTEQIMLTELPRTNHWFFGQLSSVDELLNLTYVLRRLFMNGCCLGRARAVLVVVWDLFCCLRCVSCFFSLLRCFACCALLPAMLVSSHLVMNF